MAVIWIVYILLNITVFGLVVLFARAARARTAPNERVDLEDNSIIAEEWALLREKQCLPARCPRAIGSPPRPRKDVTCEICAALFMERYWQERLSSVGSAEPGGAGRGASLPVGEAGRKGGASPTGGRTEPAFISMDAPLPRGVLVGPERLDPAPRRPAGGRRLYVAGFCCMAVGAAAGILSTSLIPGYFLIPAYLLALTGIALLIAGALAGTV
jgi:hypothetical protein